jgi:hypothetical protein
MLAQSLTESRFCKQNELVRCDLIIVVAGIRQTTSIGSMMLMIDEAVGCPFVLWHDHEPHPIRRTTGIGSVIDVDARSPMIDEAGSAADPTRGRITIRSPIHQTTTGIGSVIDVDVDNR